MVSIKTCFVNIPALPNLITVSGQQEIARFGYATTNANYLGFTSCAMSSRNTPTTLGQEWSTANCALPASVSGKAYSVTPIVVFTEDGSYTGTTRKCDPVPVASINKGNFQFACKTVTARTLEAGWHTISWQVPAAASVSVIYNLFPVVKPSSTPVYVVSPAKASTTLIPTTAVYLTSTSTRTYTIPTPTSYVRIVTSTSTCFFTVTVTPSATPLLRRRDYDAAPNSPPEHAALLDIDPEDDLLPPAIATDNHPDNTPIDLLKGRAATPTLAKVDFTYPPYGKTTVYVKSISTSTYTWWVYPVSTVTPPGIVITTSVQDYTYHTVTVTRAPTSNTTGTATAR
ncbi:hypothetical protein QBC47DRAFT_326245 [Echria macrotheca]|uniref:Uncharacterized protein n=1 Tax=Echria macrotheca TaxID=438768 RepID=A0AAJ0B9H8_9PEZI|nr:hypothetical protein QBC47DRAFT_326245 [Echria macrotheca]